MPPTFLIRKVGKRISHRLHYSILAKLLKFQETFLEKFLWSGFGAEAPTDNTQKTRRSPRFLICHNVLEPAVPNLRFKRLPPKKPLENPQKLPNECTISFWRKLFGFQRTFHEKPFGQGLGRKPQLIIHKKTRRSPRFYFS